MFSEQSMKKLLPPPQPYYIKLYNAGVQVDRRTESPRHHLCKPFTFVILHSASPW